MKKVKGKTSKLLDFFKTIFTCLKFSWSASKFYTVFRVVAEILLPLLIIVESFWGKHILDLLASGNSYDGASRKLLLLLLGLLVTELIRAMIKKANQYCQSMHNEVLDGKISLMMMDRTLSMDLEYFDNPQCYDKLTAAGRDSKAIAGILWNILSAISAAISFIVIFQVLSSANPLYSILIMAAAIPSSIAAAKYTKLLHKLTIDQINDQRRKNYCAGIAIDREFAQDVRLFSAKERLKQRYQRIWQEIFTKRKEVTKKRAVFTGALELLPEIVSAFIGIDIAFRVFGNMASIGDYSLYTGLISQQWAAILLLISSSMQIYDDRLKLENLRTLEHFKNHISDQGTERLSQVDTIEFNHVYFAYPGTSTPVLTDINLFLKKERVALVGLNGSGKSTFIKLLLRMYDPDEGTILINGRDIREYSLVELRSNFSVYFQSMKNYCFTLKENFTIADDDQAEENVDKRILTALDLAQCEDILQKTRLRGRGLNTSITRLFDHEGIELSGGQYQKLSIARTFFRRHTALILDEPSSNLDPIAEDQIFQSLRCITKGKLTIFTTHRFSNVSLADRIIVFEKGKIVEDGSQRQLLAKKNRYYEMFNIQKEKYNSDEKS